MHRIKFIPFNFSVFLRAKSRMGFQASEASAPPFYTQTSHFLNVPGSRGTSFSLSGRQTVFHQSRPTRLRKFFQEDPQTCPALQNLARSNQAPKFTSCQEPGRGRGKTRNFPGPAPSFFPPPPAPSQAPPPAVPRLPRRAKARRDLFPKPEVDSALRTAPPNRSVTKRVQACRQEARPSTWRGKPAPCGSGRGPRSAPVSAPRGPAAWASSVVLPLLWDAGR